MLLAVLEKRAGFKLGAKDVFLNMLKGKILQNVIPKYDFKRVLEEK